MKSQPSRQRRAFTLVELLVVIGIIAVLIGILFPLLSAAKERANRVKCMSNLRQIGIAMKTYAFDHRNQYPRVTALQDSNMAGTPEYFSGQAHYVNDPFYFSLVKHDPTASMFLLVRNKYLNTAIFICPSTDHRPDDLRGNAQDQVVNFSLTDPVGENYSYSFATPYTEVGADYGAKDYYFGPKLPSDFPLGADRNECIDRWCQNACNHPDTAKPSEITRMNSVNHHSAGQNVLYNDGRVVWCTTPFAAINRDNIYTDQLHSGRGGFPAVPYTKFDTVLVPPFPLKVVGSSAAFDIPSN